MIWVTVMTFVAHPTVSVMGRTCCVDPGPQDKTAGSGVTVVEVVLEEVVVEVNGLVVEAPVAEEWFGGELSEPTLNPMAVPTPRAARMSTTTPARTTVLLRTVMSVGSSFATTTHGTSRRSRNLRPSPPGSTRCPHSCRRPVGELNRQLSSTTRNLGRLAQFRIARSAASWLQVSAPSGVRVVRCRASLTSHPRSAHQSASARPQPPTPSAS